MISALFENLNRISFWLAGRAIRRTSIALTVATTVCASAAAQGGCQEYRDVNSLMAQLASQHFPYLSQQRLPKVRICQDSHIPNGLGVFKEPDLILVRQSSAEGRLLREILVHELGHFQTYAKGFRDNAAGGHGRPWMYEMIKAGLIDEARRTASLVPGASIYLKEVLEEFDRFAILSAGPNCKKELQPNADSNRATEFGVWVMSCDYTSPSK